MQLRKQPESLRLAIITDSPVSKASTFGCASIKNNTVGLRRPGAHMALSVTEEEVWFTAELDMTLTKNDFEPFAIADRSE